MWTSTVDKQHTQYSDNDAHSFRAIAVSDVLTTLDKLLHYTTVLSRYEEPAPCAVRWIYSRDCRSTNVSHSLEPVIFVDDINQ